MAYPLPLLDTVISLLYSSLIQPGPTKPPPLVNLVLILYFIHPEGGRFWWTSHLMKTSRQTWYADVLGYFKSVFKNTLAAQKTLLSKKEGKSKWVAQYNATVFLFVDVSSLHANGNLVNKDDFRVFQATEEDKATKPVIRLIADFAEGKIAHFSEPWETPKKKISFVSDALLVDRKEVPILFYAEKEKEEDILQEEDEWLKRPPPQKKGKEARKAHLFTDIDFSKPLFRMAVLFVVRKNPKNKTLLELLVNHKDTIIRVNTLKENNARSLGLENDANELAQRHQVGALTLFTSGTNDIKGLLERVCITNFLDEEDKLIQRMTIKSFPAGPKMPPNSNLAAALLRIEESDTSINRKFEDGTIGSMWVPLFDFIEASRWTTTTHPEVKLFRSMYIRSDTQFLFNDSDIVEFLLQSLPK